MSIWSDAKEFSEEWHSSGKEYRVGDVVDIDSADAPWGHAVIIGFAGLTLAGDKTPMWFVKLARPYAYANTLGLCAGHLLGAEVFEAPCSKLSLWRIIGRGFSQK
jgi:hypothetical protein